MGGLGKTALAQLVFNDKKIEVAFELKMWVCVSNDFSMEQILAKMVERSIESRMEVLQREVRKMIEGKKYLLVLDDVWDENHNKWVELELRDFLVLGGKGSKVVTTTRSKAVATAIGDKHPYELQGLSDEHSWHLFQNMAFEQGKKPVDSDLVEIGKELVRKRANVPLAIRVVGSFLHGQYKDKWLSFTSIDFRNLGRREDGQAEDGIMPILKYSYYHLSPSLKSCFSYCALFPKDFIINKNKLIWLWMAHGCLELPYDGRTMEAVGEEYCSILLHRCFFQDTEEDIDGKYYKMHDLMHDLAQKVAGNESLMLESASRQSDENIRNLSIGIYGCKLLSSTESSLGEMRKLRSLYHNFGVYQCPYERDNEVNVDMICAKIKRLRLLDLSVLYLKVLPNTIGNLCHLSYLDLSHNYSLVTLPESITKLHNLLILNLSYSSVRELPKGLRKLHNLRHLHLFGCGGLTHMPVGMDSMTNLQTLNMFVVAGKISKQIKRGHLKDLSSLVHLKGRLEIIFKSGYSNDLANAVDGDSLLSNKVHLNDLSLYWEDEPHNECDQGAPQENLLKGLHPHCDIEAIDIAGYKGNSIPSWVGSLATSFTCLVKVSLHDFDWLYNLPSVSQLLHLRVLDLSSMPNVEFIESDDVVASAGLSFFRSLEKLHLISLPKLKGVCRDDFVGMETHRKLSALQSFPCLYKLYISDCPCLTTVPRCPSLKALTVLGVNELFRFLSNLGPRGVLPNSIDESSSDSSIYLNELRIDNVELVKLLFGESLKGIDCLDIPGLQQEMLSEAADLFLRHASSLRHLTLERCHGPNSLCGGGIEHLTINDSGDLDLGVGDEPWKSLANLISMGLWSIPNLTYLPEGLQHLTSLRKLHIYDCNLESLPEWLPSLNNLSCMYLQSCKKLKSLPEAIGHMPSLKVLVVWGCTLLTDRCRKPDGQDWPKISHIPYVDIK